MNCIKMGKVTFGNIKYNCEDLINCVIKEKDEDILYKWSSKLKYYFNSNNLEDEVIIKLGKFIKENSRKDGNLIINDMELFEELNDLMVGTVPGERMSCYYQVFEPLKFRQMKINKIINGK